MGSFATVEIKKAPMVRGCSIKRRSLTSCTDAMKGNGQRCAEKRVARKFQTVQKVRNIITRLRSKVFSLEKTLVLTLLWKGVRF